MLGIGFRVTWRYKREGEGGTVGKEGGKVKVKAKVKVGGADFGVFSARVGIWNVELRKRGEGRGERGACGTCARIPATLLEYNSLHPEPLVLSTQSAVPIPHPPSHSPALYIICHPHAILTPPRTHARIASYVRFDKRQASGLRLVGSA